MKANVYRSTNSKATLRIHMKDLQPLMPRLLFEQLRSSPYYTSRKEDILISAQRSRKKAENEKDCFVKLEKSILDAGRQAIRGEISPMQAAKIKKL